MREDKEENKVEEKLPWYKGIKQKLSSIKHLDIVIALVVLAIVLLVYFGAFSTKKNDIVIDKDDNADFLASLERIISSIDGVGKTSIMINYDDNRIVEIASKVESTSKVEADGSITIIEERKEPIIIRQNGKDAPIILSESVGSIKGVIVVAKGASDVKVKLHLIDALATFLDVDRDKIKVYEMQ